MSRRNRNIVEQAKPHCPFSESMMARGTNQAKGIRILAFKDAVNRIDHGSRSQASDFV